MVVSMHEIVTIDEGHKFDIPDYLDVKEGDYVTGGKDGLFKKADRGDYVFGVVENGKIVVCYCSKL